MVLSLNKPHTHTDLVVDALDVLSVVPKKNQESVRYPEMRENKYQIRKLKTSILVHHLDSKTIFQVSRVWEGVRGTERK